MKTHFGFLCLFAANTLFATSSEVSIEDASTPLFQRYLTTCQLQNTENQPVHLHGSSQEKESSFTEMTIFDLDFLSTMQIEAVVKYVLYADADILHLTNTSTANASYLYEALQKKYAHFIHVPNQNSGLFIASKLPLSEGIVTSFEEENSENKELLEFVIHGANTYHANVSSDHVSMRVVDDHKLAMPILIGDLRGTWTIIKQQFSPLRVTKRIGLIPNETFHILPIRHRDNSSNDDRGGYSAEVDVGHTWGGKDGGCWEGTARVEAHDRNGNYVEAEVRQNDRGEGSANVRAGHEEK